MDGQANPTLSDWLEATESSSALVPNISAWSLPSPVQIPFPAATKYTLSCGLETSVLKSVTAWPHFSSPSSGDCELLPCQMEDAPGVCLVCSSRHRVQGPGCSRAEHTSLNCGRSPVSHHQLFHSIDLLPPGLAAWWSSTAEFKHTYLYSAILSTLYVQSPLDKKSTNLIACLWLSSNEAKQSSYKYYSWQFVVPLRWDQADLSSAELQLHSLGEQLSLHGLEHQRTALAPLLSGSGHPSWPPLASSRCIQGQSSQTCSHHSYSQQSFLNQEGKSSCDIMNQGKLTVKCRRIKN